MARARDPIAAISRAIHRDIAARQRESMTPDQVEAAMRKIIRAKLEIDEPISLEDFRLANLPMQDMPTRFKRVLRLVQNDMAMERGG